MIALLRRHGIGPTPQRLAIAKAICGVTSHPSADEVWAKVRKKFPTVSRATVYNTLNLFVEKGLLRTQILKEGNVLFDPCMERHHHFIDEKTGTVHDIPWEALRVIGETSLSGYEVHDYQVVLRGRRRKSRIPE